MDTYDVFVIGGGGAGSECAYRIGESKRFRVAMAEHDKLGGECNNYGCVPTKAMLAAAKLAHSLDRAEEFGIRIKGDIEIDFPKIMERVNRIVAHSVRYGSEPFTDIGVEVFLGPTASFTSPHELALDGKRVKAKKVIVATGTDAAAPPIPGLAEAGYWTNKEATNPPHLPSTIAILGAGPIGVEFAQIFARLGSKVTVIEALDRVLPPEDPDSGAVIAEAFDDEGIEVITAAKVERVEKSNGKRRLHIAGGRMVSADVLLVATGRTPRMKDLNPDAAGIELDERGRPVLTEGLRSTTARHVWVAGDATGELLFTHVATYEAGLVSGTVLSGRARKRDYRVVPKVTFCEPEVASVGVTEQQARDAGREVRIGKLDFADNERADIDGLTRGLAKVVADAETGEVLGGHIVGTGAGEMIHEIVAIMAGRGKAGVAGKAIHAYPTLSETVKGALEQASADAG
jgi:pyruvate/2-oxoglutarate dehydrogenase complex dihydrolipoamide dehydrogenase (E3) component